MSATQTINPRGMEAVRPITSRRFALPPFWVWMALFGILSLLTYPVTYTSQDEATTYDMVWTLRHGTIFPTTVGVTLPHTMTVIGPHGPVSWFPIGFPLVLAVASLLGRAAIFAINPALHLLAAWCFLRLLRSQRIPDAYALLYLFYPGFILYSRTLFSDSFAASLTTVALYALTTRRGAGAAGACLGLAAAARSVSLGVALLFGMGLAVTDWRQRRITPLWQGQALPFLIGLLPFLALNLAYNAFAFGGMLHNPYGLSELSARSLIVHGPLYTMSLMLIFPAMLAAPWFYRGRFWVEGLLATTFGLLVAGSYMEATYGGNVLQSLVAVTRQTLPVMPFYLLAYCGMCATFAHRLPMLARWGAAMALLLAAVVVSVGHEQYLNGLTRLRSEIQTTLPPGTVVYGSKDVFKLHTPEDRANIYRELPYVSAAQITQDLRRGPTAVVLLFRNRGIVNEDGLNARVAVDLGQRYFLRPGPASASGRLRYYWVIGLKNATRQKVTPAGAATEI